MFLWFPKKQHAWGIHTYIHAKNTYTQENFKTLKVFKNNISKYDYWLGTLILYFL